MGRRVALTFCTCSDTDVRISIRLKFYPLHQEVSILGPHLGLEGCPNLAEDNPVPMQQLKKVLPIFIKNTYLTLRSIVYKKIKVNQDDMEMIKKSWLFGLVKY